MMNVRHARLSPVFCLLALFLSFAWAYVPSLLVNVLPVAVLGIFSAVINYLCIGLMAAAMILYCRYAVQTDRGRGFAIAAGVILALVFLSQYILSYLYGLSDSALYRTIFAAVNTLFSLSTCAALLVLQYTRAIQKNTAAKAVGIILLAAYALRLCINTAWQGINQFLLQRTREGASDSFSAYLTASGILSGVSYLLSIVSLLLVLFGCVLFMQHLKKQGLNPISVGMTGPGVCPNCGRANGPDAKFCAVCATPLAQPAAVPPAEKIPEGLRCPSCGAPVAREDSFCPLCGERIAESTQH